jgi:hypothetical protein
MLTRFGTGTANERERLFRGVPFVVERTSKLDNISRFFKALSISSRCV